MTRKHLSARARAAIFVTHGGVCHLCSGKIQVGEAWDVSHVIPLAAGGDDDESNMQPAHRHCHRVHTAEVDAPLIAKVRRQYLKNIGAWPKSRRPLRSQGFRPTREV
jgi:5-methylcytosine-specific restriction protein A